MNRPKKTSTKPAVTKMVVKKASIDDAHKMKIIEFMDRYGAEVTENLLDTPSSRVSSWKRQLLSSVKTKPKGKKHGRK